MMLQREGERQPACDQIEEKKMMKSFFQQFVRVRVSG
jgi:hypothetical protein